MAAAIIIFLLIQIAGFAFFYLYITGNVRKRLEKDITSTVEKELNALVTEFNRSALSNVELLEERITRLREVIAESKTTEESMVKTAKTAREKPVRGGKTEKQPVTEIVSGGMKAYRAVNEPREPGAVQLSVGNKGVRDEKLDIQEHIVSLYEKGIAVREIAERVDMMPGEVEVILGVHGKL
ncbi:MAG: hypothetical protein HZC28_15830 [Spirochaetes bacterium]|nr:hypothetical protein [Spirochaetota bacterium]